MNIAPVISSLVALAKSDAAKAVLPPLAAFFTAISTNPSATNIALQLAKLNGDLIASIPGIEMDVLKQIAALLTDEATAALTPTPAAA